MGVEVLISGANRGIGLALVRAFVESGAHVFAACRKPAEAAQLHALGTAAKDIACQAGKEGARLEIVEMDVTSDASVNAAAEQIAASASKLEVLINNAAKGGWKDDRLAVLDLDDCMDAFEINSISPLRVSRAMLPLLSEGERPRIVNISSKLGAIAAQTTNETYAYGSSKAALNFYSRHMAFELAPYHIIVVAIHPGWVRTDMGGPKAPLTPEQSAAGIFATVTKLTMRDTSLWFNWDGSQTVAW
jgi:NAD(P)-dependent dehydrogenase (short-subunit alcohol dehydrogenase family)